MIAIKRGLTAAAAAILVLVPTADAGLIGMEVTSQYYAYGGVSGGPSVFTADGLAHARTYNTFDVVVTDSQIIYDFRTTGTWSSSRVSLNQDDLWIQNGNLLSFVGGSEIVGVTLNAATNMAGLTDSSLSFNGSQIAIEWMGRSYTANTLVVLDVVTRSAEPAAVSEPSTVALAGVAMVGLMGACLMKRRGGTKIA